MYCSKCGKEVPEGSAFCPACGAPVPARGTLAPAAEECPVYEVPAESSGGAPAPAQVAPTAPPAAPTEPRRKRSKKPFAAIIALALVAVAGFVAWRALAADPAYVAEQDQSGTEETVYEDFEVGDVRVVTDGDLGPRLEFSVTNNTGEIATSVGFEVTGDIAITDEYGDEGTLNEELELMAWEPAHDGGIAFLQPGENEVTLIPLSPSGTVASYTPEKGDTQTFQLDEVENVEVEIGSGDTLGSNEQLLMPEDCDVEIELAPDGSITGSITNNTDVRWRRATVHLRAENADGTPATMGLNESTNEEAFYYGEITVEYVRPGDTVDLEKSARMYYDPARVVATYVVIEEDV